MSFSIIQDGGRLVVNFGGSIPVGTTASNDNITESAALINPFDPLRNYNFESNTTIEEIFKTENLTRFSNRQNDFQSFQSFEFLATQSDSIGSLANNSVTISENYLLDDFREDQYIASYGDLIQAFGYDLNKGHQHYFATGIYEGRSILFDPVSYLNKYSDLQVAFGNNLVEATKHFIESGFSEGRTWM